jgi:hypothetical protein
MARRRTKTQADDCAEIARLAALLREGQRAELLDGLREMVDGHRRTVGETATAKIMRLLEKETASWRASLAYELEQRHNIATAGRIGPHGWSAA